MILIVEDDAAIGSNLQRALDAAGYDTTLASTAADARSVPIEPALVLLDLGLPDGDGLDVAKDLLDRWPELRIIMMTARADEMDVVLGLDSGAIDYVTKPFRLAELLARVRAHTRALDDDAAPVYDDGDLIVDTGARRVILGGSEIVLRAKEFDLLVELISHSDKVVTREQLMTRVWDENWFGSTKTLDVHIAALRRRLGEQPGAPSRITALRGVGYRWDSVDRERPT
ncbi:MAG: response regulator transcription factor [Actinobacteria bacterium]|nr:response regulator transcription factor [Actinomycetota bacterium]